MLFLSQRIQVLWLTLYILNMPFTFEMLSLILCCRENSCFSTNSALHRFVFLLHLFFHLSFDFFSFLFLLLFYLFFNTIKQFQCAELFRFQIFRILVNNNSNQHFDGHFVQLLANLINLSVFIGFYVVYAHNLITFLFFLLKVLHSEGSQLFGDFFTQILFKCYSNFHLPPGYLISFL